MYIPPFDTLNTKNPYKILKIINSTKRRMAKLKRIMEHPNYKVTTCPSELTMYKCDRDFLEKAISDYICLTGDYKFTKPELKDIKFNENINDLLKITYRTGAMPSSCVESLILDLTTICEEEKHNLLNLIKDLHVGEWRKSYSPERFGMCVLDGIGWDVTFEFTNGKKVTCEGNNAFPYNFQEFVDILEEYSEFISFEV